MYRIFCNTEQEEKESGDIKNRNSGVSGKRMKKSRGIKTWKKIKN